MKLDTSKLVCGDELLEILFTERCRPKPRWLGRMRERRRVPYYKLRGKVCYDPDEVRAYWQKKGIIRAA